LGAKIQGAGKGLAWRFPPKEETCAFDDYVTNNEITLGPNRSGGWLAHREIRLWGMSNMSVNYLMTKATADHKTPAQSLMNWWVKK
jgi:hypothetical protein